MEWLQSCTISFYNLPITRINALLCLQATIFPRASRVLKEIKEGSQILAELQADFETVKQERGLLVINVLDTTQRVSPLLSGVVCSAGQGMRMMSLTPQAFLGDLMASS